MRSRTPSVNGSVCPSPYGSMHKKVNFPTQFLSLSVFWLPQDKINDGRFLHENLIKFN